MLIVWFKDVAELFAVCVKLSSKGSKVPLAKSKITINTTKIISMTTTVSIGKDIAFLFFILKKIKKEKISFNRKFHYMPHSLLPLKSQNKSIDELFHRDPYPLHRLWVQCLI